MVLNYWFHRTPAIWTASWLGDKETDCTGICKRTLLLARPLWSENYPSWCQSCEYSFGRGLWGSCRWFRACEAYGLQGHPCNYCCSWNNWTYRSRVPFHWEILWEDWCFWLRHHASGANYWTEGIRPCSACKWWWCYAAWLGKLLFFSLVSIQYNCSTAHAFPLPYCFAVWVIL